MNNMVVDMTQYNYKNFLIYLLYAPLFIAGPIITFNCFEV